MDDAYKSRLGELCEGLHQGLEEGGVVCPRGGVGVGVSYLSSGSVSLDLGSRGSQGLGEVALSLGEGGARVANGDGHENHLSPHLLECVDEGDVLGGLLLTSLVATEVPTEEYLIEDEVAVLPVECRRIWFRCVRDSSGAR